MALYALRQPPGDWRIDVELLVAAAVNHRRLVGVYWLPSAQRLVAVFRDPVDSYGAFERISGRSLENSYRMECPKGCGLCCAVNSGAFILDIELRRLPRQLRGLVERQPYREVETRIGRVRIYKLGTARAGRCIFFNTRTGGCKLEERFGRNAKPIICRLTYCTLFATGRQGRMLRIPGSSTPKYRPVTGSEWLRAVEELRSKWERMLEGTSARGRSRRA